MRTSLLVSCLALGLLTPSCVPSRTPSKESREHAVHRDTFLERASAEILGRSGSSLSGIASFDQVPSGTIVEIRVKNAPPGWHAVHVHEVGDCSGETGETAGGHFNPGQTDHGSPHARAHHAGDLGNMWVDARGEGHHVILMPELTVSEGDHAVRGRAIVVHEGADDLTSQPSGAAGSRIGCGEIR